MSDSDRKPIWTDGHEQQVFLENDYFDNPDGSKGRSVVVSLDKEDYEHRLTSEEARALAAALNRAADELEGKS